VGSCGYSSGRCSSCIPCCKNSSQAIECDEELRSPNKRFERSEATRERLALAAESDDGRSALGSDVAQGSSS